MSEHNGTGHAACNPERITTICGGDGHVEAQLHGCQQREKLEQQVADLKHQNEELARGFQSAFGRSVTQTLSAQAARKAAGMLRERLHKELDRIAELETRLGGMEKKLNGDYWYTMFRGCDQARQKEMVDTAKLQQELADVKEASKLKTESLAAANSLARKFEAELAAVRSNKNAEIEKLRKILDEAKKKEQERAACYLSRGFEVADLRNIKGYLESEVRNLRQAVGNLKDRLRKSDQNGDCHRMAASVLSTKAINLEKELAEAKAQYAMAASGGDFRCGGALCVLLEYGRREYGQIQSCLEEASRTLDDRLFFACSGPNPVRDALARMKTLGALLFGQASSNASQ